MSLISDFYIMSDNEEQVANDNAVLQGQMAAAKEQMELIKAQMAAMKVLQRDSAVKTAVARHKSPQIKVNLLYFIFPFYNFF